MMDCYGYLKFDICKECDRSAVVAVKGRYRGLCYPCANKKDIIKTGEFILDCMRTKVKK